jgi:hypothetical protein
MLKKISVPLCVLRGEKKLHAEKIPTTEDTEEHRERKKSLWFSAFSVVKKTSVLKKYQPQRKPRNTEKEKISVPLCVLRGEKKLHAEKKPPCFSVFSVVKK